MTEPETLLDDERELPEHWRALIEAVSKASFKKHGNPAYPRHEIGRFEGIGLRGHGSFGIVFEVYDPELDRNVALKLCHTPSPGMLVEPRMLAKLSHPNVITVLDVGQYGDDVFFVMEYVHGETAHEFANRKPPPTWQEILDVYLAAGAGLAAAHAAGIVHGDFKPSNVLLDFAAKWPRVADFGLAQLERESTSDDEHEGMSRRGTLLYMAPEVLRGLGSDARSDQWAFCVSLWQTLERQLPFVGLSTQELLDEIEHTEPLCGEQNVPGPLRDVLRVGLSVDPSKRYPDMDALLRALAEVRSKLESVDVVATPPPAPPPKRPGWGAFALTVLLAGAIPALFGPLWREPRPASPGTAISLLAQAINHPPVSACALPDDQDVFTLHPVVEAVCQLIRVGEFDDAINTWGREYAARLNEHGGEHETALALDSLILGRTFVDQAEALLLDGDYAAARDAAHRALHCSTPAASTLGREHGGVRFVIGRARLVLAATAQPQHSTTPLPSMMP